MGVLPASAGMIRPHTSFAALLNGAPRIRGDDPPWRSRLWTRPRCSPHPRG